jgi:hypothetical protein
MAYLIKSVLTMLGARGQKQGRRGKNFLQVTNHQLAAPSNIVRIKSGAVMKKATFADGAARVAFRLKPASFIEVNCTAKNQRSKPFCSVCAEKI